jgi:hypothetical protein
MIKYDYTYFHQTLLRLKSLNFERYQHISEKDLLIQVLNGEEITDFWDATICSDVQPLRLKIRNICGDETVYVL